MKLAKVSKIILSSLLLAVLAIASVTPVVTAEATTERTGSITIDNAVRGEKYELWKVFDATTDATDGTKISYKLPQGKTAQDLNGNPYFQVDSAGNVTLKPGVQATVLDTPEFKAWALGFATKVRTSDTATGASVVFSGIPFGYYVVKRESATGTVITVDSTTPNATIKDKNDSLPTIDPTDPTYGKTIVTGTEEANRGIVATYAIGDKVPFQIKFNATNFETINRVTKAITEYKIVDTPTNLLPIKETLQVKVGNNVLAADKYTVNVAADGKMTIVIPWIDTTATQDGKVAGTPLYNPTETVVITYQSLVMKGAAEGTATNKADITYKTKTDPNDPNEQPTEKEVEPKPNPDPGQPDPNKPVINTYKITLSKTDGADNRPLTGAKFRLYDADNAGNEIKLVKNDDGTYRVAEKNAGGAWWENGAAYDTVVEVEAGTDIVIKGLKGQTTYYLEETKAPDGYNKLTARQAVKTEVVEGDAAKAANVSITVQNNAGVELPSTGGMGRTLFYGLGVLLIAVVVVTWISKSRMQLKK